MQQEIVKLEMMNLLGMQDTKIVHINLVDFFFFFVKGVLDEGDLLLVME